MSDEMDPRPVVLCVDDTADNLTLLADLLKERHRVLLAKNGERALTLARDQRPDLIVLDIMMPEMDGWEVCQRLKSDPITASIPIIFLTARNSTDDEARGLALGAEDFLSKPINPPVLMARVATHLKLKEASDRLRTENDRLEAEVIRRTRQLAEVQDVTILTLASLAETRDNETGNHLRRTQQYIRLLAERAATHPRFSADLSPAIIETLFKSAPLHDIGKVGIRDRILLKPGRFEPEEFEIMKTHCVLGRDAIQHAEDELGADVPFLRTAKEIAWCHQEKWDGSGYPRGLKGEEIPLSARLMAVADVYDALISRRIYKEGMPHERALALIKEGRASHFDPDLVDLFAEQHELYRDVASRYVDSDAELAHKGSLAK